MIQEDVRSWRERIYVPKAMSKTVMKSAHDSNVEGHFCRDRALELIRQSVFSQKMENDVQQYCNECDNCQRTKAPRHAKYRLLHTLELPCKPWTPMYSDFITDMSESLVITKILVAVDRFTKLAHFIPISKKGSSMVARAYLKNTRKYQ
jgi:superfamily II DNA helicase RecQ